VTGLEPRDRRTSAAIADAECSHRTPPSPRFPPRRCPYSGRRRCFHGEASLSRAFLRAVCGPRVSSKATADNNDLAPAGSFFPPISAKCDVAAVSSGPVRSASIGRDRGSPDISDISVIVCTSRGYLIDCCRGSGRALLVELTRWELMLVLDYLIDVENDNELRV